MRHIFDSLILNISKTSYCSSFPQTTGTILEGNSERIVKPIMHLIQQRSPDLWQIITKSFGSSLDSHRTIIARIDSNVYKAILIESLTYLKTYKIINPIVFKYDSATWIVDSNKSILVIIRTDSAFSQRQISQEVCRMSAIFHNIFPFDSSIFYSKNVVWYNKCDIVKHNHRYINEFFKKMKHLKPKYYTRKLDSLLSAFNYDNSYDVPYSIYDSVVYLNNIIDSIWHKRIDSAIASSSRYKRILEKTAKKALKNKASCEEINNLIAKHLSPELALKIMRHYKVGVMCGLAPEPIYDHLKNISITACKSRNFPIFLKTLYTWINSLKGMFPFSSPSSEYQKLSPLLHSGLSYTMREKEIDFIIGSCLEIPDYEKHCYLPSIALYTGFSDNKQKFIKKIYELIHGDDLDLYNKLRLYTLYRWHVDLFHNYYDSSIHHYPNPYIYTPDDLKDFVIIY